MMNAPVKGSPFDQELDALYESSTIPIQVTEQSAVFARTISKSTFKIIIHNKMCEAYEMGLANQSAMQEAPMH